MMKRKIANKMGRTVLSPTVKHLVTVAGCCFKTSPDRSW